MKMTINGKGMTVRNDLQQITEKRMAKFDKFFDDEAEATVTYSRKRNLEIAEITVTFKGTIFRSEEGEETFNNALDSAIEAIERQIRKNKTRLEKRLREGAFTPAPGDSDIEEEHEFKIRTKTFSIKPMSIEEAILQMNLLEHQFFVFRNAEDNEIYVVYRRKDQTYGLIVPQ